MRCVLIFRAIAAVALLLAADRASGQEAVTGIVVDSTSLQHFRL